MKKIFPFVALFILLAVSASAQFDPSLRSGPQAASTYSREAVCDFVAPFALEHITTFEGGEQAFTYTEDDLAVLTAEISESFDIQVSPDVIEGYILDLEGQCGARVIDIIEPEEVVVEVNLSTVSPVTGAAVGLAPGEEPRELPFPDITLGAKKPGLLTRIVFVIRELVFKDIVNFEITGIQPYFLPIIILMLAFVGLGISQRRGRK